MLIDLAYVKDKHGTDVLVEVRQVVEGKQQKNRAMDEGTCFLITLSCNNGSVLGIWTDFIDDSACPYPNY